MNEDQLFLVHITNPKGQFKHIYVVAQNMSQAVKKANSRFEGYSWTSAEPVGPKPDEIIR